MTMDQVEGNEPLHENYCTELGQEIDEVRRPFAMATRSLTGPNNRAVIPHEYGIVH
jgi:hypothetical protein